MQTSIEFKNISKQYRLGLINSGTISHDLNRWWTTKILHKEDPFLKIGETNDRASKSNSEYVWALKNINFKVQAGDVLGIIGNNGAGKSTLLKILSQVTTPTTGVIRAKGRIASLLEVGTGFHPEMTGRENIYMNGAIMGMTKHEISRKIDEIVDFSGCERYIDTPTKRYSSGMTVRLGFAIAAHLDPEIFVVDEVLAVGDAEFQKKAIGKMQDIASGDGRTVLFVSHNMTAVRNLCTKGLMLKNGTVEYSGNVDDVVDYYLKDKVSKGIINNYWTPNNAPGNKTIQIKSAYVSYTPEILTVQDDFEIISEFYIIGNSLSLHVSMHIYDINGVCVFNIFTEDKILKAGLHKAVFYIPKNLMNSGIYSINNMYVTNGPQIIYNHKKANLFEIHENREKSDWTGNWIGSIRPTFINKKLI